MEFIIDFLRMLWHKFDNWVGMCIDPSWKTGDSSIDEYRKNRLKETAGLGKRIVKKRDDNDDDKLAPA